MEDEYERKPLLSPHKHLKTYWQDIVYWISAVLFALGVIAVGVSISNDDCEDERGPCFFNYLSHWYYIWYGVWFFIWALSRFVPLCRRLSMEFQWFNFGSAWVWSILTLSLILTTERNTVQHMLNNSDSESVGLHVVILLILHFWPTIVITLCFTSHYSEFLATFWINRIEWIGYNLTHAVTAVYMLFMLGSPAILWVLYLSLFDPIDVYKVEPEFAKSWGVVWFIGAITLFFAQVFLGWYLDHKAQSIIAHRLMAVDIETFPTETSRKKLQQQIKDDNAPVRRIVLFAPEPPK
jgi:hypothetical protein